MIDKLPDNLKPAVEKAAKVLRENQYFFAGDAATDAILAFLNAAIEAGEAQQGGGADLDAGWVASSCEDSPLCNDGDFSALILRMGDK
jgi:predicted transcriptional regulator